MGDIVVPPNYLLYVYCYYSFAVSTVHPVGIPFVPVTSHVAALFLTNVPVDATPLTQLFVYVADGVVVNIALM